MVQNIRLKNARLTYRGPELIEKVRKQVLRIIYYATELLKRRVVENLSQPTRTLGPSKEGDYPHADTGRLRNSIFANVDESRLTGIVGTNLAYGVWLEWGVQGGKIIEPVNAKALSWIDPQTGERRFAKWVKQGAIRGRSFLRRSLLELRPQFVALFRRGGFGGEFRAGAVNQYDVGGKLA